MHTQSRRPRPRPVLALVLVVVGSMLATLTAAPAMGNDAAGAGRGTLAAARQPDSGDSGPVRPRPPRSTPGPRFTVPPGANDWSCRPTAARPTPVILVHGTFLDRRTLFDRLSLRLVREGYCVFALDYGQRATQRIQPSARMLSAFVQRVRSSTGAAKVSFVGHSQGGMMPRHYIRFLGGADQVDDLVGLAPSNYGTRLANALNPFLGGCPACRQQAEGSRFLQRLNRGDDSPGPVSYTNVVTRFDEIIKPHTNGYLRPADNVTNLRIQDICRGRPVGHVSILLDRVAIEIAVDALNRSGPADPGVRPRCR